jgi:hypothetical protein
MKPQPTFKPLLLLVLLVAAGGFSQQAMSQEDSYHPFADNAVWSNKNIKYATSGDTTICGKNYLKVYRQKEDHPFDFDMQQAEYFCAIRNDTAAQRVYGVYRNPLIVYKYVSSTYPFYAIVDTTSDSTEFLLYDFSLTADDTVEVASFEEYFYEYDAPGIYVYEVSLHQQASFVTLRDSSTRKVLEVELLHWISPDSYVDNILEWVEQIGNTEGTFTVGKGWLEGIYEGPHLTLLCYEQDGELLFSRPWVDADLNYDCFNNSGIEDEEFFAGNIYPNPTSGKVTISLPEPWGERVSQVAVYNANGQRVLARSFETQQLEINLHDLPNGMYLVQIIGSGKQIISTKVMKTSD